MRTIVVSALAFVALGVHAEEKPQVPLIPGTVVVFAVVQPAGDFEPSLTIRAVAPDYYEAIFNQEIDEARTGRRRMLEIPRRVRMQDQRDGHAIRSEFWEGDPLTFSGTTPFLSRAIIEDLRRGSTKLTDQKSGSLFGMPVPQHRSGTFARVGFEKLNVLVNGRLTELRVIRARGELSDPTTHERTTIDMLALDDLTYPLYLRWSESRRTSRIIRISYPEPDVARTRLEAALADREPADVYNVYFEFASATLRPQSKSALDDIAAVLKKHPDWKLSVTGHTDNIGGASNQKLSEQRAAAVREALIRQYGIAAERLGAGGHGANSPVDTNDTPEGRARNRRVVLTRG